MTVTGGHASWGLASNGELYLWNLVREEAFRLARSSRGEFYAVRVRFLPQALEWEPSTSRKGVYAMQPNRLVMIGLYVVMVMSVGAALAEAFTCPTTTTCTVTATYGEPKVNANGTTLDDLKETTLLLSVNGVASTPVITPATALTGGGVITKTVTVTAPSCKSSKVDGTAVAIDLVGSPSASATTSILLDRTKDAGCEPGIVTPFTLN